MANSPGNVLTTPAATPPASQTTVPVPGTGTPPAAPSPAAPRQSLHDQIAELAKPAPATPVPETPGQPVAASPTFLDQPTDPASEVHEPSSDATHEPAEPAAEVVDDEEFKLSWEADAEPATDPASPEGIKPAEELTAEGLEEVKSYIGEQLKLESPEAERMWGMLLKLPRARKALEAYKTLRDVEKPWEEGGVGYIPTTTQIRELVESRIATQDLLTDMVSQDQSAFEESWSYILAPATKDGQRQLRPGIENVLPEIPRIAFQVGGQKLYNSIAKPVLDNFITMMYDQGSKAEGKEKEWLLNTARGMDWRVNGTWRKDPTTNGHAEPTSTERPPQDPKLAAELESLRSRNRQYEQERLNSFRSSVESDETTVLNQGLDEALAVAKSIYTEPVYNAVRRDFAEQVSKSIKSNPVFQREYDDLLSRAQKGDTAARSELTSKFRQQAGNAIKRLRPTFLKSIKSSTAERRTEADKDREALAQVQNKVGPTSTGQTATQQVSVPDQQRPAGMSQRDWLQQRISQISGSVAVH